MTQDAIALLLDLAQRGEVDPWDIDVVQLTDRFLASLGQLTSRDLGITGQALFYASVLIHLKAQVLEAQTFPLVTVDESFILDEPSDLLNFAIPLEQVLKRRLAAPQNLPTRPLTLEDLLAHLKAAERLERQERLPLRTPSPRSAVRSMEQIKELAHQENLEALILEVKATLANYFQVASVIGLDEMMTRSSDGLGIFLALLFLTTRGLIDLEQDEFYGDILVRPGLGWSSPVSSADLVSDTV